MIWPAAALAVLLLGFVVVYGSTLQARLEGGDRPRARDNSRGDGEPGSDTSV